MSREIWLLRHGKAKSNLRVDDSQRLLKKVGKQAVGRVGEWLVSHHLIPDLLLTSPAIRAYETAAIIHKSLDASSLQIQQDSRLYFQGIDAIKSVLADCPVSANRVLLVGHNPDFENLLLDLVGVENLPFTDELIPTAALARVQMPMDWQMLPFACAKLLEIKLP
jgi:phosphohistidine phosphatase